MHRELRRFALLASFGLVSLTAHSELIDEDLRAWYPLTADVLDASGNDLHGVLPGSGMNPSFVADRFRTGAAEFDGVDDFVEIDATLEALGEESPNSEFAISLWIRTLGPGGDPAVQNVVVGAEPGGGVLEITGQGSWSGMGGSNGSAFGVNSGGGGASTGEPAVGLGLDDGLLQDGEWHHLFIQWVDPDGTVKGNDSAEAVIWIDGTLAIDANGTTAFNGNNGASFAATLGKGNGSGGPSQTGLHYTGRLSDVILFERQLDPDEILQAADWGRSIFADGFESGTTSVWSATIP